MLRGVSDEIPIKPAGCPPAEADIVVEGVYYFFARGDLPRGKRVPAVVWELPWQKRKGAYAGRPHEVVAWSHSVFDNPQTLRDARKNTPNLAKKALAEIELTAQDGHMCESHSEVGKIHFDWWCSTDAHEHDHGGTVIEEKPHAA